MENDKGKKMQVRNCVDECVEHLKGLFYSEEIRYCCVFTVRIAHALANGKISKQQFVSMAFEYVDGRRGLKFQKGADCAKRILSGKFI
ncbi:hypothetical protein CEXT_731851 [Caerostris extrusa]|uniref:Uncharacterized protein n=1 Tax=Caerostris extrusa TaxID=172846 RepID=A0AAV4NC20_CAEEX|nr:hypothetical protein CEXT_731851 [Caerostris extrusa]